jgi:precorrin-6A/cobalt-precorrin-6A reductase
MSTLRYSTAAARGSAMPVPDPVRRLLILGGTSEARALAERLAAGAPGLPPLDIVSSLAGRTRNVAALPGRTRVGGFGGAEGLAAWLVAEAVDIVVDATHPFADRISANAVAACAAAGLPRLALVRPAWRSQAGDRWIEVADTAEAAAILPRHGRRAFLSTGRRDLDAFAGCRDIWFLVRLVERPDSPLPLDACHLVTGRGPFDEHDERVLLETHAIDVLVCKASGGAATAAKLAAARALGLPVVMVRRPPPPPDPVVANVDAAIDALRGMLDVLAAGHDTPFP